MESPSSFALVKEFVQNILLCGCPESVFDSIEIFPEASIRIHDERVQIAKKLIIGQKLLIHLVSGDQFESLTHETIERLLLHGQNARNARDLNRFRLVLYFETPPQKEFPMEKISVDDRVHLHILGNTQELNDLLSLGKGRT